MRAGVLAVALALAATGAAAKDLVMAVGMSLPPYVIAEDWRGMEFDLVKEALAAEGYAISPRLMPFARVPREMEVGGVEAAMTIRSDSGVAACYSDPHVTYHNVAITLAERNIAISSVADLAGKSVVAFQNASLYLGPDYAAVAAANPQYREEARQQAQALLLFAGRIDVVVADRNIFGWFASSPEVAAKVDTRRAVRIHPIFAPTEYRVAFRDKEVCAAFNRGLAKVRADGIENRIAARYATYLVVEKADLSR